VTNWLPVEGAGGAGFGSFGLDGTGDRVAFFGVLPPGANTRCGTVFARGLGDWTLVVCIERGGSGSSSDSESDDDSDDEFEDDSSFSSKNSNTLGNFAGSGFCGFSGTAGGFRACFDPTCEDELFSTVLGLATGPACEFVETLETTEYVLFLPSFFCFLVWNGMIGKVRNQPVHTSNKSSQKEKQIVKHEITVEIRCIGTRPREA
jgi:hypothetical protein